MEITINILIGLLCILLGILVLMFYKENRRSESFRTQNVGIMLIILGIGLIIKQIIK